MMHGNFPKDKLPYVKAKYLTHDTLRWIASEARVNPIRQKICVAGF